MIKRIAAIIIVSIALAACNSGQSAPPSAQETTIEAASPAEVATEKPVAARPDTASTPTRLPVEATVPATSESGGQSSGDSAAAAPADAGQTKPVIEPIEVTYFTPSQGEGPYYTVDKPADRDNDLTMLAGAAGTPLGQVIEFGGKVYNAVGMPLSGVTVEIWQTDDSGVYLHPNDPGTAGRDQNFQFFGEAITTIDGSYSFRTILPGHYEPRPRHIHLKVRHNQEELLTSQVYFTGDAALQTDNIFLDGGSENEHLVMILDTGQDAGGNPILVGEFNIILNTNLSPVVEEAAIEEAAPEAVEATIVNTKLNLNLAGGPDFQTAIPDFGNGMVREFLEYRPYISIQQFRREIGKYVDEAQVAEYEQYVFVPVNVDESDAATLQQLPGVDEAVAAELIAARPFGSNDAFLVKLAGYVADAELAVANSFLAAQ